MICCTSHWHAEMKKKFNNNKTKSVFIDRNFQLFSQKLSNVMKGV